MGDSVKTETKEANEPPTPESMDSSSDKEFSQRALKEERKMIELSRQDSVEETKRANDWSKANKSEQKGQFNKLMHLVEQSKVFASIMQQRMEQEEKKRQAKSEAEQRKLERQESKAEEVASADMRKSTRGAAAKTEDQNGEKEDVPKAGKRTLPSRGKAKNDAGDLKDVLESDTVAAKTGGMTVAEAVAEAAAEHEGGSGSFGATGLRSANQPQAVTGGIMRSYQLEGLYWLRSLYENGLNGILADEMGLGKTVQTISFLAFLREMESYGPFLIVAPLSTLSNWIDEFARWTPSIKTVLYHGSPADRADIRAKKLKQPGTESFPVVCTSYEICMNDRKFLSQYGWKFIIIDEGHRLKNLNCRLIKELKQYQSANRLLITGTPLQNNLAELWSLLNFLMPEVFDTLENFESFFDFSAVLEKGGHKEIIAKEQKSNLISSLHAILKPFLLRRVKTDVETQLPKKREYIIYAPLMPEQKELYKQILEGNSRAYLEKTVVEKLNEKSTPSRTSSTKRKRAVEPLTPVSMKSAKSSRASTPASASTRKSKAKKDYAEISDAEFFRRMENSTLNSEDNSEDSDDLDDFDSDARQQARNIEAAKREISAKKLQNPIMQLRLACNSPHNFYWPFADPEKPDKALTTASGKMLILDTLIPYLFEKGHKVLIFSQFKTQLDILQDWASVLHDWPVCRIDGAVAQDDRRRQIKEYNEDADVRLFLLSTRAGGQGINLVAADTVVLFDSDWNPQQDLQAQDRAHRIGQTRPVIVYRLATRGTVEQTLLEKADGKRRLEKLVIQKGKFKSLKQKKADVDEDEMDDLSRILETDDGQGYDLETGEGILTEDDLRVLTDRSDEAYEKAAKGEEDAQEKFRAVETKQGSGVLEGMTRRPE